MKLVAKEAAGSGRALPFRAADLIYLTLILILALILAVFADAPSLPVLFPIIAAIGSVASFLWVLQRRHGTIPFFEIGVVYFAVVVLYTVYPLIGFILNGLSYTPYNDNRLVQSNPTTQEIGTIGWYYVVHLTAFIAAYVLVRGRLPLVLARFQRPKRMTLSAAVFVYVGITLFFMMLDQAYRVSSGTYFESYLAFNQLPFGIAQAASLLGGVRFTVELVILAVLFFDYKKYRVIISGWLACVALLTFVRLGNRTELVLLLLAAAMLYHFLVRPFPVWFVGIAGLAGLGLFVGLGLLREGWLFTGIGPGYNPFSYSTEFEVIFGNAYDLSQRQAAGTTGRLPLGFYLSDLVISVPRQFLPFEKITPADWYVRTFYPVYAAQGGGLAFGTISESLLGWGWLDLIARGAALGFILAKIHRYYVQRRPSFWVFVFYIWLATQIYQSFRNTTFVVLYLFLYRFLWVAIGIQLLRSILSSVHRRSRMQPVHV